MKFLPAAIFQLAIICVCLSGLATAQDPATPTAEEIDPALSTAVALNYCRASFHRIRKDSSDMVLAEEQEKILNNLNLSQLNDQEVITLYTSVLDEIGQISIADKERVMHGDYHDRQIRRKVTWDAVAFGTDLMTAQFGNAVRTGANSWWDYRNNMYQKEIAIHGVNKTRQLAVIQRSNTFLDTVWKMARKKSIPDSWLVRGDDLDQLELAMQEKDPEVRLRVLKRMENYMEAYPPYWYYTARTHQELGKLAEASEIYERLERLGQGHFRKDELLATALANQAAILDYLQDGKAVAAAQRALAYSPDVWEANLISARVLQRNGKIEDAEDAILRNLDVELEESQSHVFLASLYFFSHQNEKIVQMLNNPKAVAHLPAPVLLRCATMIGVDKTPPVVVNTIMASLEAYPKSGLTSDHLLLRVGNGWQLHLAKLDAYEDGQLLGNPQVQTGKGYFDLKYASKNDRGFSFGSQNQTKEVTLQFQYPDDTTIRLTLDRNGLQSAEKTSQSAASANTMKIASIQIGNDSVALLPRHGGQRDRSNAVQHSTAKPVIENQPKLPLFGSPKKSTELPASHISTGL